MTNSEAEIVTPTHHPIGMIAELRSLLRDKSNLKAVKGKTAAMLKQDFEQQLLKQSTLIKQYFNEIIELETELSLLHTLFKQKKAALSSAIQNKSSAEEIRDYQEQVDALALPLFYTNNLLIKFYSQYEDKAIQKQHHAIQHEVEQYLNGEAHINQLAYTSMLEDIKNQAKSSANEILESIWKATKLKDNVSNINIARIYWIYCHMAVKHAVEISEQFNFIDKKSGQVYLDKLDMLNPVTNAASVAFYGLRLIIDSVLLLKHVIYPNSEEASIYWQKRLSREWEIRKFSILNNIIWGITNAVTNYTFAGQPLSSQITAAVLIVDVAFNLWAQHEEKKKYNQSKSVLEKEIETIQSNIKQLRACQTQQASLPDLIANEKNKSRKKNYQKQLAQLQANAKQRLKELTVLNRSLLTEKEKLALLHKEWHIKHGILKFNVSAAMALIGSFIAASASDLAQIIPSIAPALMPVFTGIGIAVVFASIYRHNKSLAILTAGGMAAALFLFPPAGLILCSIINLAATAFYLSSKEISQLHEAKHDYLFYVAEIVKKPDEDVEDVIKQLKCKSHADMKRLLMVNLGTDIDDERIKQLDTLMATIQHRKWVLTARLVERTVIPALIIFSFAVYWPAAVGILATYLTCKFISAVVNHLQNKKAAKVENEAEKEMVETLSDKDEGVDIEPEPTLGNSAFGLFSTPSPAVNAQTETLEDQAPAEAHGVEDDSAYLANTVKD